MPTPVIAFDQTVARGCGLDVHKDTIIATIRGEGLTEQTRTFLAFTPDLQQLCQWLRDCGITHVAMESTGVYWKPVFRSCLSKMGKWEARQGVCVVDSYEASPIPD